MFHTIHEIALMIDQARHAREPRRSATVVNSHSVKSPAAQGTRGYDGAKKAVDRKRHIAVDGDGRLPMVNLTAADIADSPAPNWSSMPSSSAGPGSSTCLPTAPMIGQLLDKAAFLDFTVEIVRRTEAAFVVLPRRWVVERTFGWMVRHRRLMRDYEARSDVSSAIIDIAMAGILLRRITHP